MDFVDLAILWGLGLKYQLPYGHLNRRPNPDSISKSLGLDRKTVRSRIRKMEQTGFIKHYQVYPNLNLFGLKCSALALLFPSADAKREALNKLRLLEEVPWLDEYVNSLLVFLLYKAQTDFEKKLALVRALTGVEPTVLYDVDMPPIDLKLSMTDWLIIKSLRYDALKATRTVAEELGVTVRTVNYRLQRLVRENAFFSVPIFGMRRVKNAILYALLFVLSENGGQKAFQEITRNFGERSFCQSVKPQRAVGFIMFANRISEAEENYLKAKSIEGVDSVIMDLVMDNHDFSERIDKLIDEKIMSVKKAVGPASQRTTQPTSMTERQPHIPIHQRQM